jgi:membrane associated rhomboid family serine protease
MTTLASAANGADLSLTGRDSARPDEVSPDVARDLHADALRLKRSELTFVLPLAVVTVAVGIGALVVPELLLFAAFSAVPLLIKAGQWGLEWWRLRRTDPLDHYRLERRQERDEAAGLADLLERAAVRKPIATPKLAAVIALVTIAQFIVMKVGQAVAAAGLVKSATRGGEWWRMLTASYLHGDLMHVAGNISALMVLGSMIEAYDRPLRVPLVYLAGVLGGSLFSVFFDEHSSIGASAGVLALAGYMLVVAHRRGGDGSQWLRGRLLGMLATTALVGVVGFTFIDNAAHLGGALAGVLAGIAAAPRGDAEPDSARTRALDAAGWIAVAILIAGALFTISRLLAA